jgi:Ca-activated chloride channel family protein
MYEIVPTDQVGDLSTVDGLKYQRPGELTGAGKSGEVLTLKLRYKAPDGNESTPLEFPVADLGSAFASSSADCQFAAAVAGFGMLLRHSPHKGTLSYDAVLEIAESAQGPDASGYRREFMELVRKAKSLAQLGR